MQDYCDGCWKSGASGLRAVQLRLRNGSWCDMGGYVWCAACRKAYPAAWRYPARRPLRLAWMKVGGKEDWHARHGAMRLTVARYDSGWAWQRHERDCHALGTARYTTASAARRGCERALARLADALFEDSLRAWLTGTSAAQRGAYARQITQPKGAGR